MRCLSVARALEDKGKKVMFVTADHRGDAFMMRQGFETLCLDSEWSDMESEGLDKVVRAFAPDLLLIDSYQVTAA